MTLLPCVYLLTYYYTTIMNFRHLLEKHKISRQLFKEVNRCLSDAGIFFKEGIIVDATIIEAAGSTKNKAKERDPEMHQTQKGKQSFFMTKNVLSQRVLAIVALKREKS